MGFALYFPEHLPSIVFSHVGVSFSVEMEGRVVLSSYSLATIFLTHQAVAAVLSAVGDEFLRWVIEQDLRELVRHVPFNGSTRSLESSLHHLHCDGHAPAPVYTWLARTQVFRWEMHLERSDITARCVSCGGMSIRILVVV